MSRLDVLRRRVEETLGLIAEHERLLVTARWPEERLRSRRWIDYHWRNTASWVNQARRVHSREPEAWPAWLREAEASVPPDIWKRTSRANSGEAPDWTVRHTDSLTTLARAGDTGEHLAGIENLKASHLTLPVTEGEDTMYSWEDEMLNFARLSVEVEDMRRMLQRRTTFRPGELRQAGISVEEGGSRAKELRRMVIGSKERLPHPTLEPRAVDDLDHIAVLSQRIVEALDNMDIEASLGESASRRWVENAERNMRTLDHYIASACDWMSLSVI